MRRGFTKLPLWFNKAMDTLHLPIESDMLADVDAFKNKWVRDRIYNIYLHESKKGDSKVYCGFDCCYQGWEEEVINTLNYQYGHRREYEVWQDNGRVKTFECTKDTLAPYHNTLFWIMISGKKWKEG
jgi:hypothetical protein